MKINEVAGATQTLFRAKIKLQQTGYKQLVDTTVVAKNMQMAIKLLKSLYGKDSVVGIPKAVQHYTEAACPQCQQELAEATQRLDPKCWTGYRKDGTKMKDGVRVNNCVKVSEDEYTYEGELSMLYEDEQLDEAEYQGRKVSLGKPIRSSDGPKKFHVFVKDGDKVKKVNFGDPNMSIKKSNPARRKSFRARHRCATPGPRTMARYWSCRAW